MQYDLQSVTHRQEVIHLRETGGIPRDICDKITELYNTLGKCSVPVLPQSKPALFSYRMEDPPLKVLVKIDHTPREDREVMARRGDYVIVYGWIGFEAIAYNTRNKTTGIISQPLLSMEKGKKYRENNLYRTTVDGRPSIEYPVSWKKGEYIRIVDREEDSHSYGSGVCFDLASGKIGRFYTDAAYTLKLAD
jgi:hypothetical protein